MLLFGSLHEIMNSLGICFSDMCGVQVLAANEESLSSAISNKAGWGVTEVLRLQIPKRKDQLCHSFLHGDGQMTA